MTLRLIMHLCCAPRDRLETCERDLIWPTTKLYAFTVVAHTIHAIIIIKSLHCAFMGPTGPSIL